MRAASLHRVDPTVEREDEQWVAVDVHFVGLAIAEGRDRAHDPPHGTIAGHAIAADQVEDRVVDAYYLAGTPEDVAPRAIEVVQEAREHGINQIAFAKLGPDYAEAIDCLAADVLPYLR